MKRTVVAIVLAVPLVMFTDGHAAVRAAREMKKQALFVDYATTRHIRTLDEDREIYTSVSLSADQVAFSIDERVMGARMPVVHETHYHSENLRVTPAQKQALIQALTAAGLKQLRSDKDIDYGGDYTRLDVDVPGHDYRFSFGTPAASDPRRAAVIQVLMDFVHKAAIDSPRANAIIVSEGDLQPAQAVTIPDLLARPDAYNGKRVSVTGYFRGEFEGQTFCKSPEDIGKGLDASGLYANCLWRGEPSTFATASDLIGRNNDWQRIEGVFFKGPTGHMGLWPGQMVRLTRTETTIPAR